MSHSEILFYRVYWQIFQCHVCNLSLDLWCMPPRSFVNISAISQRILLQHGSFWSAWESFFIEDLPRGKSSWWTILKNRLSCMNAGKTLGLRFENCSSIFFTSLKMRIVRRIVLRCVLRSKDDFNEVAPELWSWPWSLATLLVVDSIKLNPINYRW